MNGKVKSFTAKDSSPRSRVFAIIDAFVNLQEGQYCEFKPGQTSIGEAALMLEMGDGRFPILVSEAEALATIMEEAFKAHPNDPAACDVPDFVMGLRYASGVARKINDAGGVQSEAGQAMAAKLPCFDLNEPDGVGRKQ